MRRGLTWSGQVAPLFPLCFCRTSIFRRGVFSNSRTLSVCVCVCVCVFSVCVCVCVCHQFAVLFVCVCFSSYPFFPFRILIFLDFPRFFTRSFALIFRRLRSFPYHSAAPFPDFLHPHFVYASTRTRHPLAFYDNLAILTVVNPFSTRRWLGTKAGTSISLSCVLMCASAPPGFVRMTFLYVTHFMELRQCLRGNFR